VYGVQEDIGCGAGGKADHIMNRTLMEVIVELLAFLELNDFDEIQRTPIDSDELIRPRIDDQIVLKAMESAFAALHSELTPEERAEFASFVEELGAERQAVEQHSAPFYNPGHKEYMDFLAELAEDLRYESGVEEWQQDDVELPGDGK